MKTNVTKQELKTLMNELMDHVQLIGGYIGNPELHYMTDDFRDRYAEVERPLEALIAAIDTLGCEPQNENES